MYAYLILQEIAKQFCKVNVPSYSPNSNVSSFYLAILVGVYWYASVVLIFTCPIAKNVELLFMCRLPICVSSFVKCLLKCFVPLKNWVAYFVLLVVRNHCTCKSFVRYMCCKYLFLCGFSLHFLDILFGTQFQIFIKFNASSFLLCFLLSMSSLKNLYLPLSGEDIHSYFP